MQKKFTKNVILSMLVGMLVTVIAIFSIQHIVCTNNNISTTKVALEQVIQRLKNNEHEAATLRASLDANSIAKARAFAHMIELNPEIIKDTDEMVKIAALLDVDEVHVTDENGILYWGNIPDYYGFDFSTGEQTKPFMDILKDSSLEMAQDPQPNATKGVLFQYTSVARRDKPGIVQIGLTPQVLEDTLANNAIEKVLGAYDLGNNGYVFAIQEEDGTILAHKNNSLIGKNYKEAGFSETMISKKMGNASGKIDGIQVLYSVTEYNDMIIGIATPTSTVYTPRNEQTFVFLICSTIIFAILILIINNMLKKNVIVGINQIIDNLQKITSGNLDVVTSVRNNKEFEVLSDSINTMVGSIKNGFAETEIRMEENAKILDQQQELFQQIKDISTEIKDFSEQTLSISQSINEGVLEQSNSVEDITDTMQHLSTQADQNAEISKKVSEAAYRSSERVTIANTAMGDMQEAMREIAANSEQIKTIINNIDNIAEQTNLLALNAAIEAARAGDAGRGFSVVAEQVRDLATQSTFAASETKQLIQNALTAIAKGENIASKTVEEFNEIIIDTKKVGDEIEGLVTSSKMQTETIQQATKRVAHISTVVENNTVIAEKSETTSQKLTAQAEKLNAVINS